ADDRELSHGPGLGPHAPLPVFRRGAAPGWIHRRLVVARRPGGDPHERTGSPDQRVDRPALRRRRQELPGLRGALVDPERAWWVITLFSSRRRWSDVQPGDPMSTVSGHLCDPKQSGTPVWAGVTGTS